ncbi:MAG: hypothetical protein H7301_06655 [Cryobacterium sp.]|nr:hypothetical protein [Oligoflexia bacterium]
MTAFRGLSGLKIILSALAISFLSPLHQAQAGLFNMPHFVEPGKNAVGFEPEITLTHGGGVAGNIHYTQGLTPLNNLNLILGTGTDSRQFRVGGSFTFDFVPDIGDQPGMGIAAQAIYYRYHDEYGQLETAAIPYIHKSFHDGQGNVVEPFLALPLGPAFRSGHYKWTTAIVLGAMYQPKAAAVRFIGELGVNLNKTESYISGGILYQPE